MELVKANLVDPWNRKQRIENVLKVLSKSQFKGLELSNSNAWPEQSKGNLRINVQSWTDQEKDSLG